MAASMCVCEALHCMSAIHVPVEKHILFQYFCATLLTVLLQ